ncbi:MAG: YwiC-like family protein [Chloroflexi bacterium]|nr:YwiC-like family protein [Chloroflexota bacterium]
MTFSIALGTGAAPHIGLPLLFFVVAAFALFFARYPLTLLVKGSSKSRILFWEAAYLVAALLALLPLVLVYHLWWLVAFGIVFLLYLASYLYVSVKRKQRTEWGEMVGISGLAMAAPAAFYVSSGVWQMDALYLWLLGFLYHASSVFYVPLKVRHRTLPQLDLSSGRKWQLGRSLLFYLAVLGAIVLSLTLKDQVPSLALVAYLPLVVKSIQGVFYPSKIASVQKLGWTEVAHGLAFTGLMVAAYHITT